MKLPGLTKVNFTEILLFTKHLDTMVKAGIPIDEALATLEEQAKSKYFRKVIKSLMSDIKNGQSLAKSLRKHPEVFNQFFVSLIEVGEESGTLEENLTFLSGQLAKDNSLRKKIKGALLYPGIVLTATFVMGTFIAFFVLPKLVEFFESFDVELPLPTRILLFVSQVTTNYGLFILAGLILLFILFNIAIARPYFKAKWHHLILRLPFVGKLIGYGQIARFSRNFGTLMKSGVPISRSLEITTNTLSNLKFKKDLTEVSKYLQKGKGIGDTIYSMKYFEYPPIVSRMIQIGEKTGKLDETLLYLSNFYEDEIDDVSKNLSTILEPILLIGIGLLVGFVAVSIISPIYELTGSIRR